MRLETAQKLISEAITWLGTPYAHRQATKGAGADCGLFPLAVYRSLGLLNDTKMPDYSAQWFLHQDRELYLETVEALGARNVDGETPQPGDFAVWKIGRTYSHGGIVIQWPVIVHALRPRSVMVANALQDAALVRRPFKLFRVDEPA